MTNEFWKLAEEIGLDAAEEDLREKLQSLFRGSLYLTAKYLCGYSDMSLRTHQDMVHALESDADRILVIMPRGTFKSSVTSVAYPIWELIRNPNKTIFIDSEVYTNSKNFLREIRSKFKSELFMEVFGDWEGSIWTEGEINVKPRTSTAKEANITAGGIGTVKVGQHYDIIIEDDLNSPNNSETVEGREKVIAHHKMNIPILQPGGRIAVVATRYADNDVPGHILTEILGIKTSGDEWRKFLSQEQPVSLDLT